MLPPSGTETNLSGRPLRMSPMTEHLVLSGPPNKFIPTLEDESRNGI